MKGNSIFWLPFVKVRSGLFALILLSLFFSFPTSAQDSVLIVGQVLGKYDFKTINLNGFSVTPKENTVVPVNEYGFFSIKQPVDGARQMTISGSHFRYDFFVTPSVPAYRFSITVRNGDYRVKLEDSPENDAFSLLSKLQQNLVKDCAAIIHSNANGDSSRLLLEQYFRVHNSNLMQIKIAYPATVTGSFLAPGSLLPYSIPKLGLVDTIIGFLLHNPAWNDPQWYNTDMMLSMIMLAEKFTDMTDYAAKQHFVDVLLTNSPANDTSAKLYQQILFDYFLYQLDETALKIYCNWATANKGKIINVALEYKMEKLKNLLPGSLLTDIRLTDNRGVEKSLASVAGTSKYTLLMFWSVNCDHCLTELPELISFYKEKHVKGLEVFAVAIDCEKEQWNKMINDRHLSWVNVFEPIDKTGFSADYMVTYTPTLVLIDGNGKILSRFGDLDWIKNILKKNGF